MKIIFGMVAMALGGKLTNVPGISANAWYDPFWGIFYKFLEYFNIF